MHIMEIAFVSFKMIHQFLPNENIIKENAFQNFENYSYHLATTQDLFQVIMSLKLPGPYAGMGGSLTVTVA